MGTGGAPQALTNICDPREKELVPEYKRKSDLSKLADICLDDYKTLLQVNNQMRLNAHIAKQKSYLTWNMGTFY